MTWLTEIEKRCEAATQGPWFTLRHLKRILIRSVKPRYQLDYVAELNWGGQEADDWHVSDAEFIAHAREDIPKLIQMVKAQQEVVSWAQGVLTALNVGDMRSESLLHKKLREVMIRYRKTTEEQK